MTRNQTVGFDERLGNLLVAAGSIEQSDVDRILEHAQKTRQPFGEAAVKLRILKRSELERALARQFDHTYLEKREGRFASDLVAAYAPFTPKVEALRAVRVQLMLSCFGAGSNSLAIVSPEAGEGRSFIAANLAVLFSQLGQRTLLIDTHIQKPRQHEIFGIDKTHGLSTALVGPKPEQLAGLAIPEFKNLHVLPAGPRPPNAADLLARDTFGWMLDQYADTFDVVLCDTPPGSSSTVADWVAARCRKALVVVRKNLTRQGELHRFVARMRMRADVVGAVFNRG
jgi:protein-tyrosine kinase